MTSREFPEIAVIFECPNDKTEIKKVITHIRSTGGLQHIDAAGYDLACPKCGWEQRDVLGSKKTRIEEI